MPTFQIPFGAVCRHYLFVLVIIVVVVIIGCLGPSSWLLPSWFQILYVEKALCMKIVMFTARYIKSVVYFKKAKSKPLAFRVVSLQ